MTEAHGGEETLKYSPANIDIQIGDMDMELSTAVESLGCKNEIIIREGHIG